MSKTITQLDTLSTTINAPTLEDIYTGTSISSNWGELFSQYFSTEDCIPVSHKVTDSPDGFITYKLSVSTFEAIMHELRKNSISSAISSSLQLKELAWQDKSDLGLKTLAYRSKISYQDIVAPNDVASGSGSNEKVIPLTAINTTWGNLHMSSYTDLRLGDLSHKSKIVDGDVDTAHKLTLTSQIKGYGDLAVKDESALKLSALAHEDKINLKSGYGTFLEGNLSFKHVDEYRPILDNYYLLSAASSRSLGGVKTGYESISANYPLLLDDETKKAYTTVPWTDGRFSVKSLAVSSPANNKIDVGITYSTIVYTPLSTAVEQLSTINASTTVQTYIQDNVIASSAECPNQIKNTIAVFSSNGRSPFTIKPIEAKIDPNSNSPKYLKENGTWGTIAEATQTAAGLLSKDDKTFIDNLRIKPDYALPAATTTIRGGIKLGTDEVAQGPMTLYTGEEVVSLPLRMNSSNQAFVNIPKSLGNSQAFDKNIGDAVADKLAQMLNSLYPRGAIYITTDSTCPLTALIPNSVWTKIEGRYLLASGKLAGTTETYSAVQGQAKTVDSGLPDHTHGFSFGFSASNAKGGYPQHGGGSQCAHSSYQFTTDSASNAVYGKSKAVRPPAFVVNVFMRTA